MHRPSRTRGFCRAVLLTLLVASLLGSAALAQVTSGTIFGTVKDASGAVIPNAKVTAQASLIGESRTVTTNGTGDFVIPNLPPATYTIITEAQGFKKLATSGVVLSAADKLNAGVQILQVGAADSEVTVAADVGQIQIQANSGERSDVITGRQLDDVALNGRNLLDYAKLVPGIVTTQKLDFSSTGGLDGFNINGTRANEHEFTIDGASNVDTGNNGGTHVTINTDAIEEVKVLTSNYQAEFGRASGGQIAVVTKSGSNEFHGGARFFHRNEGLNANDYFNNKNDIAIEKYRLNDFGYQIGGPVIKNKMYFFWNQEWFKQLVPQGRNTFYTPTDLEKAGDFSKSVDSAGNPVVISGVGVAPGTNKIDPSLLNPSQLNVYNQMKTLLALFPEPNVTGYGTNGLNYNYVQSTSYSEPRREDNLRVDYQINDQNRAYVRWTHNTDNASGPLNQNGYGSLACMSEYSLAGNCYQHHPGWNFAVNLVSTLKPNLLNEFSVGPSRTLTRAGANGDFISRGANNFSLPLFYSVSQGTPIPDLQWWDSQNNAWNWNYFGATPWFQSNVTINVNDNLTWQKEKHTFKAGVFYQKNRKIQVAWGNNNGEFQFGNGPSSPASCPPSIPNCSLGSAFASILQGNFNQFIQTNNRPEGDFRYNQLEWYVQDSWKATSRLTLDLGVRFVWIPPQYDAKDRIALFNPNAYDPSKAVVIDPTSGNIIPTAGTDTLNGMQFVSGSLPRGAWNDKGVMPEPRLGFAYDLLGDHKTVLRGGFGMTHDRTQGNLIFNEVFSNAATVQTPQVNNNNVASLPTLAAQAAAGLATQPLNNVYGADQSGKVPTIYSYSLGIQRELLKGTTLDVAYVGNQQRHLVTARDINAIPYGTKFTAAAQNPACFGGSVPAVEPNLPPEYAAAGYNFSGACAYNDAFLVPYKGYGQIEYLKFDGDANYNSLQIALQRRFSKALTFGATYTWSKSLTDANTDEDFQDPYNPKKLDYRAASWDRKNVFAANWVYDLPSFTKAFGGPKWLKWALDDYQFSGVAEFMSGTPIDTNIGWIPGGNITGSNDWTKIQPLYWAMDKNGNLVLPTLGAPQRGTRDAIRTGGLENFDMSIFKNFRFTEQRYLQIRLEAYNAFNHTNFNNKNLSVNYTAPHYNGDGTYTPESITKATGFGTYNSTYLGQIGGPRIVQLGAKVYF